MSEKMNLYGDNVVLRAITQEDSILLFNMINDPDLEQMLGGSSYPVSMEKQVEWIQSQEEKKNILRCIIAKKESEKQGVGTIILSDIDRKNGTAQIHIKMDKVLGQRKGYGTDALKTIVQYAFNEMRLNCIYADVLEYNVPSQKLFEKCSFTKDGVLRSRIYKNGGYRNIISYSLLKKDVSYAE